MAEICAIPTKPLPCRAFQFAGLIIPTLKAAGSNPVGRTKMNDPTQFEQVDETYGLSRVILRLKRLDVTALLRIDAPWKI